MPSAFPSATTVRMSFFNCCYETCGVMFGMTEVEEQKLRTNHDWFYCTRGHQQHFSGLSDNEKLKKQLETERAANAQAIANLTKREEWAKQEAKKATYDAKVARSRAKATVTITRKLRQQIKDGQCPCCDEKFPDLAEHMTTKHPTYKGVRK